MGGGAGPATLDVAINPLDALTIVDWQSTLTLNNSLTITGINAFFNLGDTATISLAANTTLTLLDLVPPPGGGNNSWAAGTITGAASSAFTVSGSSLDVSVDAGSLGVNMNIQRSPWTNAPGSVQLVDMNQNLMLTGTNNYIDVQAGGTLSLNQQIAAAGAQNTQGGITLAPAHTGSLAVQIEAFGTLTRNSTPVAGITDQVTIGGAVYNVNGATTVKNAGDMLRITGADASGYSYWQTGGTLTIDAGANLSAAGSYEIDAGQVTLTAPAGGAADELDGACLIFGNTKQTSLIISDATPGTPGTVQVQGSVTLAANTTTTMHFVGGTNTPDQLIVQNGALTLAGALSLTSSDGVKPNQALTIVDPENWTAD